MLHRVNRKSVLRIQMQYVWNTFAQEPGYSIATGLLNVNKNHLRTVGYQHLTSAKCILARRLPFVKAEVAATPESSTAFSPHSRSRFHQAMALYRLTMGSLVRVPNNSITTQGKKAYVLILVRKKVPKGQRIGIQLLHEWYKAPLISKKDVHPEQVHIKDRSTERQENR